MMGPCARRGRLIRCTSCKRSSSIGRAFGPHRFPLWGLVGPVARLGVWGDGLGRFVPTGPLLASSLLCCWSREQRRSGATAALALEGCGGTLGRCVLIGGVLGSSVSSPPADELEHCTPVE